MKTLTSIKKYLNNSEFLNLLPWWHKQKSLMISECTTKLPWWHNSVLRKPGKLVPLRDSRFKSGLRRNVIEPEEDSKIQVLLFAKSELKNL